MRLLISLGAGFAVAFGVGWLCHFSYPTDWIASLVLSCAIYLSIQIDELYTLILQSVPGAMEHAKLPGWIKKGLRGKGDKV
jgi:hypothetical protein